MKILAKAAEDLQRVEAYLIKCLEQGKLPCSKDLRRTVKIAPPALEDHTPEPGSYDLLLAGGGQ